VPNLGMSNRSQSASNPVFVHHTRILKIGDQRLAREIGRMSLKIQKIAPQRFAGSMAAAAYRAARPRGWCPSSATAMKCRRCLSSMPYSI
jgi:hypothetical protein